MMESALRSYKNLVNPSVKDERDGCRSLICDANGIIIAEVVYRCMICSSVLNSIVEARSHYHSNHIDLDEPNGNQSDDPVMFPEDDLSMEQSSEDEEYTAHNYSNNNSSRSHNRNDPLFTTPEARGTKRKPTRKSNVNSGSNNNSFNTPSSFSPSTASNAGLVALDQCSPGSDVKIQTSGTNGTCTIKSGYITCPVCMCTKFYTTLQRRYGQFSCVGCYRFFKEFFVQPKRFACPNLGDCVLDQRTKCKACWIQRCIDIYTVDDARRSILMANRPLKKAVPTSTVKTPNNGNGNGNSRSIKHEIDTSSSASATVINTPSSSVVVTNGSNVPTPAPVGGSSLDALNLVAPNHSPYPCENNNVNSNLSNGADESNGSHVNGSSNADENSTNFDTNEQMMTSPHDDTTGCNSADDDTPSATSKACSSKSVGTDITSSGTNLSHNNNNNNNSSIKCESDSEESANSIEDADDMQVQSDDLNSTSGSMLSNASYTAHDTSSSANNSINITISRGKAPPRRKTSGRIKNWCCLKCVNCIADDCGKCINCLDRPKFGGPFIRKQRCLYKKCLMKTKPVVGN